MKTIPYCLFISVFLLWQCISDSKNEKPEPAEEKIVEEKIFGVFLTDPYRHLEDVGDSSVVAWFKANASYSRKVIDRIPGREDLIEKMKEFDRRQAESVYNLRITENDKYFFLKEFPDDETGKLYFRDGYTGEDVLLFDPENYNADTLTYTISDLSPSSDGNKIAFEISPNGSENAILLVLDVETRNLYPEKIDRVWGASVSWLPAGDRFFYNRLNSANVYDPDRIRNTKVYLHVPGEDPENDREVFSSSLYPELEIAPGEIPSLYYSKNTQHVYAYLSSTDPRLKVYYAPLSDFKGSVKWKKLFSLQDNVYDFYAFNDELYVYTPENAPNFKIVKTSFDKPELKAAEPIVLETAHSKLEDMSFTKDGLYYTLSTNGVKGELYYMPFGGEAKKLDPPQPAGQISISSKGIDYPDLWVGLRGWTTDHQRYRYLLEKNEFITENLSSKAEYPEYEDLTVEEVMVKSHDGVEVPLSLVYKKGLKKEGNAPVLLYGYGSYGYSMSPFFSPDDLLWVHNGGIFAIAHVRGGGELGEMWHKAGQKQHKPNTWKDFIASAEYLIGQGYTSASKIAIYSGSAGGILVGRAMTERPDLFACAIPAVGFMNTVRVENDPLAEIDIPEFGDVQDSLDFLARLEMDSYHHIVKGEKYPATLVTAGMNDPRVIPWQPGKFAARLQAANGSEKPILFLPDYGAGHGIGNTKSKQWESLADVFSFALWQCGHPSFQVK